MSSRRSTPFSATSLPSAATSMCSSPAGIDHLMSGLDLLLGCEGSAGSGHADILQRDHPAITMSPSWGAQLGGCQRVSLMLVVTGLAVESCDEFALFAGRWGFCGLLYGQGVYLALVGLTRI